MLAEIRRTRQIAGEPRRRWFSDERMDLTVWYGESDEIIGFQLTYDKPHAEKAVTWHRDTGILHAGVDDGERRPGKYKGTPILVADGALDGWSLCGEFRRRSRDLDRGLRAFISDALIREQGNA